MRDSRSIVRRQPPPKSVSRPVVTPIFPSVVYRSGDADELDAQYEGRLEGYTYAREGHPNASVLSAFNNVTSPQRRKAIHAEQLVV